MMTTGTLSSSSSSLQVRPLEANKEDQEIVWQVLGHAAQQTNADMEEIKANPFLQRYAKDFGKLEGDLGVVAIKCNSNSNDDGTIVVLGAAWIRALGTNGFACSHLKDDDNNKEVLLKQLESLPELAIACLPEHRGKGVGTALLQALLQAAARCGKYPGICLSTHLDNSAAMALYEKVGFVRVPGTELEQTNEAGSTTTSLTMKFLFQEDDKKKPNQSSFSRIRPLEENDQEIVWRMLMHAAHESDLEEVKANPLLQPYAKDFGQHKGDLGVVAFSPSDNAVVGAAWIRSLGVKPATSHLSDEEFAELKSLPELAIACVPEYRGMGVGTLLLQALIKSATAASACGAQSSSAGICLSCREGNPAMRLYERIGFVTVPGTEQTNRVGSTSVTMKYMFDGIDE